MRRLLALLLLLPSLLLAQEANLVADEVLVTADGRLVARGNVTAFYEGAVLSASQVTYDRDADQLLIEGPILLRDADGNVLAADSATLDPDLRDGLLRGARLVLARQTQIAAARLDRLGGLTALTAAVATSCQVCPGRRPLWEIGAARVVQDEAAGLLYFENAVFRVRGVPLLWLPRLRLPDPGNSRATGLLVPRIRTTDQLGLGLLWPLFVELGPSRDLTLTPYLSPRTRTLSLRYRQAFRAGDLQLDAGLTRDDLRAGTRGLLAATGAFDLGLGLRLSFDGRLVSDDAYLLDYGLSEEDRIESTLDLVRVTPRSLLTFDITHTRSLREDDPDPSLPPITASLAWERRLPLGGGELRLGAGAEGALRPEGTDGPLGRDVARLGLSLDWRRDWVLPAGLLLSAEGLGALDLYRTADDPGVPPTLARLRPAAAVTLRWPLLRRDGATVDLLEPVASLGWSGAFGGTPADEDSRLPELDEANLHALSRLPGEDAVEEGARLSLGLSWTRQGPGYAGTITLGRLWRAEPADLPPASGLSGTASDLLLAARLDLAGGFALDARALLDGGGFGKSEARLAWDNPRLSLSAAYLTLPADAAESRPDAASEWTADATWRPDDTWSFGLGGRYDVANDAPARAAARLGWRNECVEVDVSLSRRYTSTAAAEPSTDFGLSVNLLGFAVGGRGARPGACRG